MNSESSGRAVLGTVQLRNFTPHPVVIALDDGRCIRIASEGCARIAERRHVRGDLGGVPLFAQEFGTVEGLPSPEAGVLIIVSSLVLHAATGRGDLVAPDTGEGALRDDDGRIVGTCALMTRA